MRVEPDGPVPNDLALFGEAPGWDEQMEGMGFVGKAGKQLWADMKRFVGLTRPDFYVSNIVKIGLAKNRDPKPAEIAAALPEFLDELEAVQPRIVVTAGAFATRAMLGDVKMSDVHGIPHTAVIAGRSYIVMPIYHPAAGLHNKGFLSAFAFDLGRLRSLLDDELEPWAPTRQSTRSQWLDGAISRVPGYLSKGLVVGLDTEGWPDAPKMLSFTTDGKTSFVIRADEPELKWFAPWVRQHTVVMHNGIHDLPVLRAMGVHIDDFHDTQVLGYHDIIRTGSGVLEAESQNLGTLAYRECGMQLGELADIPGVDFSRQIIPYTQDVLEYAGADAIATYRLFKIYDLRRIVKSEPYQIDMGQVGIVEQMIANGMPFDGDAAVDYYADVLEQLEVVTADLRRAAARLGNRDFNPGSHPQVRELITKKIGLRIRKRTKGGLASTNERALADHQDHPFVKLIQTYRELAKLKGTYLEPLLEELGQ